MSDTNGTNETQPEMPEQLPEEIVQTWLDQVDTMRMQPWVRVRGRDIGAVMDEFRDLMEGDREVIVRREGDQAYIGCMEARIAELKNHLSLVRGTRDRAIKEVERLTGIMLRAGISWARPEDLQSDENQG